MVSHDAATDTTNVFFQMRFDTTGSSLQLKNAPSPRLSRQQTPVVLEEVEQRPKLDRQATRMVENPQNPMPAACMPSQRILFTITYLVLNYVRFLFTVVFL